MTEITIRQIPTHKLIRDPIHGHISLTKLEFAILQLPVFNRLHDIKQMGMAHLVYPGAIHTRFTHSLGAMHLASSIAYRILQSLEKREFRELFPDSSSESERLRIIQTVRLAALLHDVGHGAFSHATEDIMRATMVQYHHAELDSALGLWGAKHRRDFPVHEYYSFMLVKKSELKDVIEDSRLGRMDGGLEVAVHAGDVAGLLAKADDDVGFCSEEALPIVRRIVSSQLDSDRMDYLVRDAYMTGVPYGEVDVHRIISQMLIRRNRIGELHFAVHERAIGSVEDFLDARFKMYKWLASHHMVVAANELLKQAITESIEKGDLSAGAFYWKQFSVGEGSDTHVVTGLLRRVKKVKSPFRGLVDRRYFPVSLLKRPRDHEKFENDVKEATGMRVSSQAIRDKLPRLMDRFQKDPYVKLRGYDGRVLAVPVTRTPYRSREEKDIVWLTSREPDVLHELTEVSQYFSEINREWATFPSYYISYVVPGKTKAFAASVRMLDSFRKKVVSMAAES